MRRWASLPGKFLRLPTERQGLLADAWWQLFVARLLLRLLPFRGLTKFLIKAPSRQFLRTDFERQQVRRKVSWAINLAAKYLPGETVCFPRGLAAQTMCRKRGINAILYYGAAVLPSEGLAAHVWVLDGDDGIVGHQTADKYRVLACFPL
ncbi:MAG TPA: lasso peptide biosynthesis B2 protein [Bryobacteraceae bacterium]|nr:lasso peptide biosynthesis B2 protein [Bryobacteraceae bacterium]